MDHPNLDFALSAKVAFWASLLPGPFQRVCLRRNHPVLDVTKPQIRPKFQVDVQHPVMVIFELAVYVLVTDCGIFELMDPVCGVSQWTCQTVQNNF